MSTAEILPKDRTRVRSRALGGRELQRARDALASEGRLDLFATELGYETEEEAFRAVGEALGLRFIDLSEIEVDRDLLQEFPSRVIHRHHVFPIRQERGSLVVATSNPFDLAAIDAVTAATGRSVTPVVVMPDELDKLIKSHLGVGAETVDDLLARSEEQSGEGVEILDEVDFDGSEDAE
ncbi:MAG TPA: type II/IV secretion system protein, partial [Planctomycetaceae bacterium]|nr:type II/IV secretion system protein [Planctomycetaceae bacterium]